MRKLRRVQALFKASQRENSPTPPANVASESPVAKGDYGLVSYSQEGEDVVLRRFLKEDRPGFYIDVGAHHPERFSNTYYYYRQGWRGINIDADPDLIEDFKEARPRDINVACAIGSNQAGLTFYVFNERAINTFDKTLAQERLKVKGWEIVEKREIPVKTLSEVLDNYVPKKQKIDFLSVDVEGKDMDVLKSNNWQKYRPNFVLVECYGIPKLDDVKSDPVAAYLKKQGYVAVAKTLFTVIFANIDTYEKK